MCNRISPRPHSHGFHDSEQLPLRASRPGRLDTTTRTTREKSNGTVSPRVLRTNSTSYRRNPARHKKDPDRAGSLSPLLPFISFARLFLPDPFVDGGIVWSLDHTNLKHLEEHLLLLISDRHPPPLQALQPHLLPRPFRLLIIRSPPLSPPQVTRLFCEGSYSPSSFPFRVSSTRSPTFIFTFAVIISCIFPLPIAAKL